MKGIEKLTHLTTEQREKLIHSANQYKRLARIYIEVLDVENKEVTIKIFQLENKAEKYLPGKDLKQRAQEVFEGCMPEGWEINLIAVPYKFLDQITLESIREKQKELGLTDTNMARLLNIRKENMSRIMNGKRGLTQWQKSAFYYLFKWLEKEHGKKDA
ncbi:hypothetical protein ACT29H_09065 [Thermophagus sp. OGC60D27]|uniref:hypothetical protein n=1 Tax=Thermophagus sp. OGC60D27 TaxID=3458415 RepID=UPI00403798FE